MEEKKKAIIEQLAKDKLVEDIINNLGLSGPNAKDLSQYIYLSLLEKPSALITDLYDKDELKFYICKMALNNINSKTSPYYFTYRRTGMDNYGTIEDISDD